MKPWHLWVSFAAILAGGFLLSQDALAQLAWRRFNRPDLAVLLVRHDAGLAMLLGNYYFGQTLGRSEYDLAKAGRAFSKAVAVEPGIIWGHYQLARIYFVAGDSSRALKEISLELEKNPENIRSLYVRGLIYGYRGNPGDLQRAEDDFRRFTQWAPKEWAGYNDLAWILSKAGNNDGARETILAAFREVPDAAGNPWLWNGLGVAELNLGNHAAARAAFERAGEEAERLTAGEWRRSYPGNDPQASASGLEAFRDAIAANFQRAAPGGVDNRR